MKVWKKSIGILGTLALLLSVPLSASADTVNQKVKVSVKVMPKANFGTNFDSLTFAGAVGQNNLAPVYSFKGQPVTAPAYHIKNKQNYWLAVSGTDFTTGGQRPVSFTIQRLSLQVGSGSPVPLAKTPTLIDSGRGPINTTKTVEFKLDLSDVGNSFPDNSTLSSLKQDTDFTSTVTFSFLGL